MGVAAKNSSSMNGLMKSSEGAKTDKSVGFAAQIAKRALSDKKKSGETTSSSLMPCICAPTTHPGSFRCRLHRAKKTRTKTTQIPRWSRFARDVSQESSTRESLLTPQYNSE